VIFQQTVRSVKKSYKLSHGARRARAKQPQHEEPQHEELERHAQDGEEEGLEETVALGKPAGKVAAAAAAAAAAAPMSNTQRKAAKRQQRKAAAAERSLRHQW
jgi:hypothetical protein